MFGKDKLNISNEMIKNFLIISCIGKNDSIGLRINNNFFIKKFQTKIHNNEVIISNIIDFLKEHDAKIDNTFSIIVNLGPGSFSAVRVSIAIAKGIKISKGVKLYGYKDSVMDQLNLKNIEFLIKENLFEKKMVKPLYIS